MKVNSRLLPLSIAALTLSVGVINIAHAQEQVVKIGHTGPLSGANAFAGKDNENGVRMAVDELNTKKLVVGGKTLKNRKERVSINGNLHWLHPGCSTKQIEVDAELHAGLPDKNERRRSKRAC